MWWEKEKRSQNQVHPSKSPEDFAEYRIPPPAQPAPEEPHPALPATFKPLTERVENPMTETNVKPPNAGISGQHHTYLGGSAVLRGELTADEDLTIEGQFEGTLNLQGHCLNVGQHGQVKADITARQVAVSGKLNGKINAQEKIEIRRTGNVVGDLVSAGVAIEEGAYFKGSIEILRDEDKPAHRVAPPVAVAMKAKAEA